MQIKERKLYKVLSNEEKELFFDEKTNYVYDLYIKNKQLVIKKWMDYIFYKRHAYGFSGVLGNGISSLILDSKLAEAIGADYVNKRGYDIDVKRENDIIRLSSKSLSEMFVKSGGTASNIIDSNKITSNTKDYDDKKHLENIVSDCYIFTNTNEQLIIAIAPHAVSQFDFKNSTSNTTFTVPNDSYLKYIVSKEDNVFYDNKYVPDDPDVINSINCWNKQFHIDPIQI